jgi:hypothetical protein
LRTPPPKLSVTQRVINMKREMKEHMIEQRTIRNSKISGSKSPMKEKWEM